MTGRARFVRFNVVSAAGFVVQIATVGMLTRWTTVSAEAATAAGVAAAVAHNFLWHRRWTWVDRAPGLAAGVRTFARFAAANGAVSLAGNVLIVAALAGAAGLQAVTANVVAVVLCGLLNYQIGDRLVFRAGLE